MVLVARHESHGLDAGAGRAITVALTPKSL